MNVEDRLDAATEILKEKYGMSTALALTIDVVGTVAGAWLFVQPSHVLTLVGFVIGLVSLSGLLNKVLHGGLE